MTNSVLHGGPPVVVAVDCDEDALQVRVRDGSRDLPAPRDAAQGDENGRGLALVAEMSDDWGVDPEARRQARLVRHPLTRTCDGEASGADASPSSCGWSTRLAPRAFLLGLGLPRDAGLVEASPRAIDPSTIWLDGAETAAAALES